MRKFFNAIDGGTGGEEFEPAPGLQEETPTPEAIEVVAEAVEEEA